MKFLHLLAAVALLPTSAGHAAENRYDILGKLLAPFIDVLTKNARSPNRALALTARVERLTGLPPALAGSAAELSLQYPDRLRLHGPLFGEDLTICRDRQQVWATPGAKVKALLDLATAGKKVKNSNPVARLEPLQLPIPEKQLVFLPVLFQVKDAGSEAVDGESCRVLDLALMPELEKSLEEKGWAARVWVRPDYRPARLVLTRPSWELAVKFEKVEFFPKLPAAAWAPPADDVLLLDAPRFRQLMQAVVRGK